MRASISIALLATLAAASPVAKRQATSTVTASSVTTVSASSASASGSLSAISINSGAISAAHSSGSASSSAVAVATSSRASSSAVSSSASSAAPSASAVAFNPYNGTCPTGYSLTYDEDQVNVSANLSVVAAVVANWTGAPWLDATMGSGSSTVGATRVLNGTVHEVLINDTTNSATGAIFQSWNLTSPWVVNSSLTISNYTTVLQIYTNLTDSTASQNVTTAKWFTNFCASNQTLGAVYFSRYIASALTNLTTAQSTTTSAALSSSSAPSSASSSAVVARSSSAASSSGSSRSASSSAASSSSAGSTVIGGVSSAPSSSARSSSVVVVTSTAASTTTAAPAAASGSLMINTPAALVECQPAAITFSGGQAPYFLSVLPGGQTQATALEQFPEQSAAGIYTWTVNIPSSTSITLEIRDNTGEINYSAPVTVQAGTSTSCLS